MSGKNLRIGGIIAWLVALLVTILALWHCSIFSSGENKLFLECTYIGTLAGILYCLRGLYVHIGKDDWNSCWTTWYFLRPMTSAIGGFASYIFLQAGLLTLGASACDNVSSSFGFWAFAFIAGYNVDNFMNKIESVAKEMWGIQKSRSCDTKDKQNEKEDNNHG